MAPKLRFRSLAVGTFLLGMAVSVLVPSEVATAALTRPVGLTKTIDDSLQCLPSEGVPTTYDYGPTVGWRVVGETSPDDRIWSGHAVSQAMAVAGDSLYVAYYDADRRMTLGYRSAPGQPWTTVPVSGPAAVVGWDSHNGIVMEVDAAGNVHVAGNMHGDRLRYWRTTVPGDLSTLERVPTMVDASIESAVTYPAFFHGASGELLFHYRQGGAASGATYVNRYDTARREWAPVVDSPLFDGRGAATERNAYFELSSIPNSRGFFEATWVWRDTPDAATNSRLSYARSRDLVHWETAYGRPIELPIRYDTPGVVIDDIPEGGGILNGRERTAESPGGQPVVAYFKYDEDGDHQIYAATPRPGGQWQVRQLTHWEGRIDISGFGSLGVPLHVTDVEPTEAEHMRVDFACSGNSERTGSLVIDMANIEVVAETPRPLAAYPTEVARNVPTDSAATVGSQVRLEEEPGHVTTMRWQSQGFNADRPFEQVSPPLPLRLYDLRPSSAVEPPRHLRATSDRRSGGHSLSWRPPEGVDPSSLSGYLVECSVDRGASWTIVRQVEDPELRVPHHCSESEVPARFRVSVIDAAGVGRATVTRATSAPPADQNAGQSQPAVQQPEGGWQPYVGFAIVIASAISVLVSLGGRTLARRRRRRGRTKGQSR